MYADEEGAATRTRSSKAEMYQVMTPPPETPVGPQFALDTIDPLGPEVKIGSTCRQDFVIGEVTDGNAPDTLYYRWYVDYSSQDPLFQTYVASGKIAPAADGSTVRHGPRYTLDATSRYLKDNTAGSTHWIEIIVADRPFDEDSTVLPKFKVVSEGGYWFYYAWHVTLTTDCLPAP